MAKIALRGPADGVGTAIIEGPVVAGEEVFTLPATGGRILTEPDLQVPAFAVYRSNSTQAINTVVVFDVERFDFGSGYDTATGRFQPTVAGVYLVTATLRYTCTGAANILPCFRLNGAVYFRGNELVGAAGQNFQAVLTTHIQLNGSTDYVDVYAAGGGACSLASVPVESVHTFSGHLVRAA